MRSSECIHTCVNSKTWPPPRWWRRPAPPGPSGRRGARDRRASLSSPAGGRRPPPSVRRSGSCWRGRSSARGAASGDPPGSQRQKTVSQHLLMHNTCPLYYADLARIKWPVSADSFRIFTKLVVCSEKAFIATVLHHSYFTLSRRTNYFHAPVATFTTLVYLLHLLISAQHWNANICKSQKTVEKKRTPVGEGHNQHLALNFGPWL